MGPNGVEYNLEDFLRDIKIAIVDMSGGLKEVKERLTALEGRIKIDTAQLNEKWN